MVYSRCQQTKRGQRELSEWSTHVASRQREDNENYQNGLLTLPADKERTRTIRMVYSRCQQTKRGQRELSEWSTHVSSRQREDNENYQNGLLTFPADKERTTRTIRMVYSRFQQTKRGRELSEWSTHVASRQREDNENFHNGLLTLPADKERTTRTIRMVYSLCQQTKRGQRELSEWSTHVASRQREDNENYQNGLLTLPADKERTTRTIRMVYSRCQQTKRGQRELSEWSTHVASRQREDNENYQNGLLTFPADKERTTRTIRMVYSRFQQTKRGQRELSEWSTHVSSRQREDENYQNGLLTLPADKERTTRTFIMVYSRCQQTKRGQRELSEWSTHFASRQREDNENYQNGLLTLPADKERTTRTIRMVYSRCQQTKRGQRELSEWSTHVSSRQREDNENYQNGLLTFPADKERTTRTIRMVYSRFQQTKRGRELSEWSTHVASRQREDENFHNGLLTLPADKERTTRTIRMVYSLCQQTKRGQRELSEWSTHVASRQREDNENYQNGLLTLPADKERTTRTIRMVYSRCQQTKRGQRELSEWSTHVASRQREDNENYQNGLLTFPADKERTTRTIRMVYSRFQQTKRGQRELSEWSTHVSSRQREDENYQNGLLTLPADKERMRTFIMVYSRCQQTKRGQRELSEWSTHFASRQREDNENYQNGLLTLPADKQQSNIDSRRLLV